MYYFIRLLEYLSNWYDWNATGESGLSSPALLLNALISSVSGAVISALLATTIANNKDHRRKSGIRKMMIFEIRKNLITIDEYIKFNKVKRWIELTKRPFPEFDYSIFQQLLKDLPDAYKDKEIQKILDFIDGLQKIEELYNEYKDRDNRERQEVDSLISGVEDPGYPDTQAIFRIPWKEVEAHCEKEIRQGHEIEYKGDLNRQAFLERGRKIKQSSVVLKTHLEGIYQNGLDLEIAIKS